MEIALPGLKNEFDLPAKRINFQHGGRLPYCGRHSGDKEVPGQEGQGGLRRRVTFFSRLLPGFAPAFVHDRLGDTRHNQPSRHTLLFPQDNRALAELLCHRREPGGERKGLPLPARRGQERRLMIEPTETIGASRRQVGERFELKIA